jgi:hypothetical protein
MAQANSAAASTDKVTVACKHPHGIVLQLYKMEEQREPAPGGTITVKRAIKHGDPVTLYGTALMFGQQPNYQIVGGYALTPNIPADFMEEWMKQNRDSPLVKNSIIFVNPDAAYARDEAVEKRGIRGGLEPIKIETDGTLKDKRVPKGIEVAAENQAKPLIAAE